MLLNIQAQRLAIDECRYVTEPKIPTQPQKPFGCKQRTRKYVAHNESRSSIINKSCNTHKIVHHATLANAVDNKTNGCRGVDLSMRHICGNNPQMHTAFENLMIHVYLQIAITIALRCVLHRRGNRGIPCQNFFLLYSF